MVVQRLRVTRKGACRGVVLVIPAGVVHVCCLSDTFIYYLLCVHLLASKHIEIYWQSEWTLRSICLSRVIEFNGANQLQQRSCDDAQNMGAAEEAAVFK